MNPAEECSHWLGARAHSWGLGSSPWSYSRSPADSLALAGRAPGDAKVTGSWDCPSEIQVGQPTCVVLWG